MDIFDPLEAQKREMKQRKSLSRLLHSREEGGGYEEGKKKKKGSRQQVTLQGLGTFTRPPAHSSPAAACFVQLKDLHKEKEGLCALVP